MAKHRARLNLKSIQILILAIFFLFSLRVITWFQYPYILVSGDFRPTFLNEAFDKRVLNTWDEIDFGIPSVYSPRILDPFYFLMTVFQTSGLSLFSSEVVTVFAMYFVSSILMYVFVKQLTNNNLTASFVAAFFLTSNVYLINDREITAVGFIDSVITILPCLITFVRGLNRTSYKWMAVSGILCVLTFATFPNYRTTLVCLIMLGLVSFFFSIGRALQAGLKKKSSLVSFSISLNAKSLYRYLKLLAVFGIAFLLASIWVIALIVMNFGVLTKTYSEMTTPWFVGGLKIYDVTRLIARWGFYSGELGRPYLPYDQVYLSNPLMIFLCYLPAVIAFGSLFLSKERKIAIFFGSVAIVSLFLTSGFSFSDYGKQLYSVLTALPLLKAFREASNWILFAIFSLSILIGCAVSAVSQRFNKKALRIAIVGLVAILFISTAYPLTTGDVSRNWLKPEIKGSYLPSSYFELNNVLSNEYWALFLPERGTYIVYNFSEAPFGSGNPYPLIFSKPVITGSGTEYVESENSELISELHYLLRTDLDGTPKFLGMLGIKYLILEKDLVGGNRYGISELKLDQNKNFVLANSWNELTLFNNTSAMKKIYAADNVLTGTSLDDLYQVTKQTDWSTLQHSVFVNSTSISKIENLTLKLPENLVWNEFSPTSYEVRLESKGAFALVFLESYDVNWKLFVNCNLVPEADHQEVATFANGWLISDIGKLTIKISYATQDLFTASVSASVISSALLLAFLGRAELKTMTSSVRRRLRREPRLSKVDQHSSSQSGINRTGDCG